MKRRGGIIWGIVFVLIFLLSQDYLFVKWNRTPDFFGFPKWIGWFAIVHMLFIGALYLFSKKYWKE